MAGCSYLTRKKSSKHGSLTCGAIREHMSDFCPKHKVMVDGEGYEMNRRMEKARAGKERKKRMRDALVDSPLRAYNPAFDEKKKGAYSR